MVLNVGPADSVTNLGGKRAPAATNTNVTTPAAAPHVGRRERRVRRRRVWGLGMRWLSELDGELPRHLNPRWYLFPDLPVYLPRDDTLCHQLKFRPLPDETPIRPL